MTRTNALICTKLHLPYIRPALVQRPCLQEKVAQGLRGPLTLVTTLIASCIKDGGLKATWLSLDKNDNQPERFLRCLIAALQAVDNSIGHEATQMLAKWPAPAS